MQGNSQNNPYSALNLQITQDRMYKSMREQAVNFIANFFVSLEQENINDHDYISQQIKIFMDKKFRPTWHCIVGKGFGSSVTYMNQNFLFLYICNKAVMVFRH